MGWCTNGYHLDAEIWKLGLGDRKMMIKPVWVKMIIHVLNPSWLSDVFPSFSLFGRFLVTQFPNSTFLLLNYMQKNKCHKVLPTAAVWTVRQASLRSCMLSEPLMHWYVKAMRACEDDVNFFIFMHSRATTADHRRILSPLPFFQRGSDETLWIMPLKGPLSLESLLSLC